jgi:AraC family transcriptional activator of pobA
MKLKIRDDKTGDALLLFIKEDRFDRLYFSRDRVNKYFAIAWNPGKSQTVTIDGAEYEFLPDSLITLLFDQTFSFERPADIVAWQFNRWRALAFSAR